MTASSSSEQTQTTGATTWQIDSVHSNVEFSVRHMMIATVKGQFANLAGTIHFDEQHPENSSVEATVDASSVTTYNEQRDNHLRTNDFFNAEQWPDIKFKSTKIEHRKGNEYNITGDLTIRDVTKPVVLDTEYDGQILDAFGMQRAAFTATTEINRKDFGVNWNGVIESGGVVVGDKVKVTLNIAATRQD